MSWTSKEVALWVRGSVQEAQVAVEAALGNATVPKDGFYTEAFHKLLLRALATKPEAQPFIADFDDQGPRGLGVYLGMETEAARDLEAAWAWWNVMRRTPKSQAAYSAIQSFNAKLAAEDYGVLGPAEAAGFVGDAPAVSKASLLWIAGGLALVGFVAAAARAWGSKTCIAPGPAARRGQVRLGSRGR